MPLNYFWKHEQKFLTSTEANVTFNEATKPNHSLMSHLNLFVSFTLTYFQKNKAAEVLLTPSNVCFLKWPKPSTCKPSLGIQKLRKLEKFVCIP